jgi:hypothetical protein
VKLSKHARLQRENSKAWSHFFPATQKHEVTFCHYTKVQSEKSEAGETQNQNFKSMELLSAATQFFKLKSRKHGAAST